MIRDGAAAAAAAVPPPKLRPNKTEAKIEQNRLLYYNFTQVSDDASRKNAEGVSLGVFQVSTGP